VVLNIKKNEYSYIPQRDMITKTITNVKIVQQQQQNLSTYCFQRMRY